MQQTRVIEGLRVGDLMRRDVVTIEPEASARELAELLGYHEISGVPVVDAQKRVLGVVSATDLVRVAAEQAAGPSWYLAEETEPALSGFFAPGRTSRRLLHRLADSVLDEYLVRDLMTPAAYTVREEATLPDLARFLLRTHAHRALVVREGRLEGIVTARDVLRAIAAPEAPGASGTRPEVALPAP